MKIKSLFFVLVVLIICSCVPTRKLKKEEERRKKCETTGEQMKEQNQSLESNIKDLRSQKEELEKRIKSLQFDTAMSGNSLRTIQKQYDKINELNNEINKKFEQQKSATFDETKKILSELQSTKGDLQQREDILRKLEGELKYKEKNLNELTDQLLSNQKEMEQKQIKLDELQKILSKKDSVVKALKTKVSDALIGFENKGLSINQRNGKIYVSVEESLLFPSGSFTINSKGAEALKKLAKVLEANQDVNILVEGHTDNVPYKGAGQLKDNWDLSVMRATSIVKILIENSKIDPKRLSAAGRSEYFPIEANTSSEGRAKNRRTEIILTPKLDELFKIIESN